MYLKWPGDRRELARARSLARSLTARGKDFGNGQPPYATFGHPINAISQEPIEARPFAALHHNYQQQPPQQQQQQSHGNTTPHDEEETAFLSFLSLHFSSRRDPIGMAPTVHPGDLGWSKESDRDLAVVQCLERRGRTAALSFDALVPQLTEWGQKLTGVEID